MIQIKISSLEEIDDAAVRLIKAFGQSRIIAFSGEMGAGKTTLIQSVCKALGVKDVVNSPTFALINEYFTEEGRSIFHFDLYRIEDLSEMYDLGYEDYFYSDSSLFIEWPEKAAELMPEGTLFLKISVLEDGSRLVTEVPSLESAI
jgi:tRNA threonylcarbamoyladenosine biosynthesis protein TsaE